MSTEAAHTMRSTVAGISTLGGGSAGSPATPSSVKVSASLATLSWVVVRIPWSVMTRESVTPMDFSSADASVTVWASVTCSARV